MAGVPAGRLSIEIVAEIARLQTDLNKAKREVAAASGAIGRDAKTMNENIARSYERMGATVTRSAGAQRAGMQQLGMQMGDMATMYSLGAKPMQIFASQAGQVTQAVQMMAGGTSKFATFLGGPWGIALSVGAIVLIPLIAKLFEADQATKNLRESQTRLADSMTGLADSRAALDEALGRNIGQYRTLRIAAIEAGIAEVEAAKAAVEARRGEIATTQRIGAQYRGNAPLPSNPISALSTIMAGMAGAGDATSEVAGLNDAVAELNNRTAALNNSSAGLLRLMNGGGGTGASGGLSGASREHARAMDTEAQAAANLAEEVARATAAIQALKQAAIDDASAQAIVQAKNKNAADNLRRKTDEEIAAREEIARRERELMEETNEIARRQIQDLIGMIGQSGGAGGVIGTLLGITSGNIGSIGGKIGDLLNIGVGTSTDAKGNVTSQSLGDIFRSTFKLDGEFGKTMSGLLKGAGIGGMASNSILGPQGVFGQLGGSIGGALGQELGAKFLTKGFESIAKGLGAAAGPLGSIIGGLAGSLLGGMLTTAKVGTASIGGTKGGLGITGTSGNSNARIDAASKNASSIVDSLYSLADQFGASVDGALGAVSIGIRDGNFRVDTTGQGITRKKKGAIDFGEDAEAAAKFAMLDLIKDGVLVGLKQGTENLLRNAKDFEAGISKALKFNSVFDDLKQRLDPVGFAMEKLTQEFTSLRKIFDEAGATAAEYADLEKLLGLKRQEAIDAARQSKLDEISDTFGLQIRMLELMGKSEEALTAARILEIAGMKAALQPLQAMVYELEDARGVIEKFGPLGDSLRAFREELLGQAGGGGFAGITARFRNTAGNAATGDANALAAFQGDASAYLEAARANAGSALEYQRALSEVLTGTDKGIFAADTQVQMAQLQIDAISNQTNVIQQMRTEIREANVQIAGNSGALLRLFQRFEGEGLLVRTDADTPLATVAS